MQKGARFEPGRRQLSSWKEKDYCLPKSIHHLGEERCNSSMSLFPFPWMKETSPGIHGGLRGRERSIPQLEGTDFWFVRQGQEMGDTGSFSVNSRKLYLHTKNPDTVITAQKMYIC